MALPTDGRPVVPGKNGGDDSSIDGSSLGSDGGSVRDGGLLGIPDDDPSWHHSLPDHAGPQDYLMYPVLSTTAWVRLLCDNFGTKFVAMNIFGEHFLKGVLLAGGSGGLVYAIMYYVFGHMNIDSALFTALVGASTSPWALKPLLGILNDSFPIYGYRGKYYLIIIAVLGTMSYAALTLIGSFWTEPIPGVVALLFFLAVLQISWSDLIVEGVYTAKMKDRPTYAPDILSWVWSGINIFGLLGVGLAGPLIDTIGPWLTCIVAIPFSSAIILPTLSGWLSEKRIEGTQLQNSCIGFRKDMFTEHRNFFVTALALGASSLTCTATAMFVQDSTTKLVVTLVASFICCSIAWILLPRDIAKALLYFYGSSAINIYISGPVFYFYTDPPEVCADCPHFSATFFTTFIGLVDCTFSIFGVFIFNRFMRNWTFRSALVVTQIIAIIASLIDIVQFQRWISPHPISDEWLALGKAGFQNTSLMMNFLPGSILISRMCPKNIETLSFALLAGFSNFGSSCAAYFGAFVIELFPGLGDVDGKGTDDFTYLWAVSLISSMLPLFSLALIPFLVPPGRMNEKHTEAGTVHDASNDDSDDKEGNKCGIEGVDNTKKMRESSANQGKTKPSVKV